MRTNKIFLQSQNSEAGRRVGEVHRKPKEDSQVCPGWRCLVGSWRPVIRSGFYVLGPELEAGAENREADVDLCGQIAAEAVVWLLGQVAARAYGQFYCPLWSGIIHLYIESPKTHRRKPHLLCRVYRALHTRRQTSFWAFPPAVSAASTRMDTHSSCATNPAAAELLHPQSRACLPRTLPSCTLSPARTPFHCFVHGGGAQEPPTSVLPPNPFPSPSSSALLKMVSSCVFLRQVV